MREVNERNPCGPCEDRECDCCLHFREAWTAGSIYRPGEAVPYNGSSYVALHLNQNDPPPSGNWAQIAAKGDAGPEGPAGPQGPQGPGGNSNGVYAYHVDRFLTDGGFTTEGKDLTALEVPPGMYIVMATVLMQNVDNDDQSWTVELRVNDDKVLSTARGRIVSDEFGSASLMVATGPLSGSKDHLYPTLTLRGYGFNIVSPENPAQFSFAAIRVGQYDVF